MKRKITAKLLEWKNSPFRKPLVLQGARQVGKTYAALEFGREYFQHTAYFNFDGNRKLKAIFDEDLDPTRIVRLLSSLAGFPLTKDTLVVFDEIQACESALASLKYFCEQLPQIPLIAAGSLLGLAVHRSEYSFPVGKVDMWTMHPMDFEEFLDAAGRSDLVEWIRDHYLKPRPFPLHELAEEYYRNYLLVGGMPLVVSKHLLIKDFNHVRAEQKTISDNYLADMSKYTTSAEAMRIREVFESLPYQLAENQQKYKYSYLNRHAKSREYGPAIEWLLHASVVLQTKRTESGRIPLAASVVPTHFKLYMGDIGLMSAAMDLRPEPVLLGKEADSRFMGALTENYVVQALVASGHQPYYWYRNDPEAEIDFLIQSEGEGVVPIEVKSGRAKSGGSLRAFMDAYRPKCAIRISERNFGLSEGIRAVPHYAVFCIQ